MREIPVSEYVYEYGQNPREKVRARSARTLTRTRTLVSSPAPSGGDARVRALSRPMGVSATPGWQENWGRNMAWQRNILARKYSCVTAVVRHRNRRRDENDQRDEKDDPLGASPEIARFGLAEGLHSS